MHSNHFHTFREICSSFLFVYSLFAKELDAADGKTIGIVMHTQIFVSGSAHSSMEVLQLSITFLKNWKYKMSGMFSTNLLYIIIMYQTRRIMPLNRRPTQGQNEIPIIT